MELNDFVKVFDRLLPRSRAWNLLVDRPLRKFFHGLSIIPKSIKDYMESILLDAFPLTTSRNLEWSYQFGQSMELSGAELEAEWAQSGGQSPAYFQAKLHEAGFTTCFIHEWPVPGSDPLEARDPIALVPTSMVLVNDIGRIEPNYLFQCGDDDDDDDGVDSQCDPSGDCDVGAYDGYHQVDKVYECPDIETEYPNYFYVCAETWPEYAEIPASSLRRLKRLIYKLKPMHLRCILRVYLADDIVGDDYDIQDTIDHPIIFADNVADPDPDETIQDYS